MTKPPSRTGASLVIELKPTGLRHISPSVWIKYVALSHQGETEAPAATGTRMANPSPTHRSPKVNFVGLDGWRFPSASHNQANTGAIAITRIGCTDWNQAAGNTKLPICRLMLRSANRLSDDPACSNADQ